MHQQFLLRRMLLLHCIYYKMGSLCTGLCLSARCDCCCSSHYSATKLSRPKGRPDIGDIVRTDNDNNNMHHLQEDLVVEETPGHSCHLRGMAAWIAVPP